MCLFQYSFGHGAMTKQLSILIDKTICILFRQPTEQIKRIKYYRFKYRYELLNY
jgi:hypothetical protein